jgi:hypothetical protein
MGRRSSHALTPLQAKDAVAKHFQRLVGRSGVNLTQFHAQLHEEKMVDVLVGFALDKEQPAEFRRDCAKDVIVLARGPIVSPWVHDGATLTPATALPSGRPAGEAVNQARIAGDTYLQVNMLVAAGTPVDLWPEEVVAVAGDIVEAFRAEERTRDAAKTLEAVAEAPSGV